MITDGVIADLTTQNLFIVSSEHALFEKRKGEKEFY